MPADATDERIADRNVQLLRPEMLAKGPSIRVAYVRTRRQIANDQSSEVTDEQPTLPTDDHLDQITDDQIAGELPKELQE